MSNQGNTHRAAVLTPGAAHYGNGSMVTLRPGLHADLPTILAGTLGRFEQHATIVVDGARAAELGAHGDAVRAAGWQFSKLGAWTLYHRSDGRTVAVGCRDDMHPRHFGVLFNADTDPGALAVLLDRYARVTGLSWRGTCATTALNAIRLSWENTRYQPRWNFAKTGPGYAVGPLIWSRPLNEHESWWGYVHTFDATAAYLGAAGNASLAWSTLEHTGPRPFDKSAPGYWHVRLAPSTLTLAADPGRPPLLPAGRVVDGCTWLTTPYAEFLAELGDPLDVLDSWTAVDGRRPAGYRVLRGWGEQLRDARGAVEELPAGTLRDALRVAVKRTYKDATGGMQREGMRVYRPDWAHTLIDLWRATLYRRMIRVRETQGVWPVAVKTDAVYYADSGEHPQPRGHTRPFDTLTDALNVHTCAVVGCGCAGSRWAGLGTYKHDATVTTEEWLRATQRPERIREVPSEPVALVGRHSAAVGRGASPRVARRAPGRGRVPERAS